jgi:putative phosphoesterase
MKIGVISDTHGFLDPKVFEYFRECDEVWHGGDIGDIQIVEALEKKFKTFRAVFGNIDDKDIQVRFPEDLWFECGGLHVLITHIAGAPPRYNPRIKRLLNTEVPDILVCGHSHILRIAKDPAYGGMLYVNPGAAGNQGFHHMKTLVRFDIQNKDVKNMEVIELGRRGVMGV